MYNSSKRSNMPLGGLELTDPVQTLTRPHLTTLTPGLCIDFPSPWRPSSIQPRVYLIARVVKCPSHTVMNDCQTLWSTCRCTKLMTGVINMRHKRGGQCRGVAQAHSASHLHVICCAVTTDTKSTQKVSSSDFSRMMLLHPQALIFA